VNDSDNDGLIDSAESSSKRGSLGKRVQIENLGLQEGQSSEFYFPQLVKAQSAQVTVSINAGEGQTARNLTYSIYINDELLYTSDPPIFNESYHSKIIDIKQIVEEKHPIGYGGKWEIVISLNYKCLLEEFSLDATTGLDPINPDSDGDDIIDGIEVDPELNQGWITNPLLKDTDGDGWSDSKEIYREDTNPLSKDTDADGIIDPRDIAPKHDLIIEVEIKEAHKYGTFLLSPNLQVTLEDRDENAVIYSTVKKAEKDIKGIDLNNDGDYDNLFESYWYSTSEWDSDEDSFYFDINDDDHSFRISGRIYEKTPLGWSDRIFSKTYNYDPKYKGHSQTITKEDDGHWLKLKFHSRGIERVNTIAVYENGTYSEEYGRYYTKEKMVVVQLEVKRSADIWEKGINIIVIPKSAFLNTELNSAIQKSVDDKGNVDWSIMPVSLRNNAEISGVDRANAGDETSEWIELVITKKKCSVSDANAILNLLLRGVVNETTGEIDFINLYDNNSQHKAELMNLPNDVLENIPMKYMGYVNDKQGEKPQEFDEWVEENGIGMLILIVLLWAGVGFFLLVLESFGMNGLQFFQLIVAMFMALIEAIVKSAILAFFYLEFAISLLVFLTMFAGIVGLISLLKEIINCDLTISINEIIVEGDFYFIFGYSIEQENLELLELTVPVIKGYMDVIIIVVEFKIGIISTAFKVINFGDNIITALLLNEPLQTSENSQLLSTNSNLNQTSTEFQININTGTNEEVDPLQWLIDLLSGFGFTIGIISAVVSSIAGALSIAKESTQEKILYGIGIAAIIAVLLVFILTINSISVFYLLGMSLGALLCAGVYYWLEKYLSKPHQYMKKFRDAGLADDREEEDTLLDILNVFDLLGTGAELGFSIYILFQLFTNQYDEEPETWEDIILSLFFGGISLGLSIVSLVFLHKSNRTIKARWAGTAGSFCLILSGILGLFAVIKLIADIYNLSLKKTIELIKEIMSEGDPL